MTLNDKILYTKRSKSCLKHKNLSFEQSGQKPGQSQKTSRTTHTSPKMRTCLGKSERMVTLPMALMWLFISNTFCVLKMITYNFKKIISDDLARHFLSEMI